MNHYYLVTFTIINKEWANRYVDERKKIYFIAEDEKEIEKYIKAELDRNTLYNYTIESCNKDDLKGLYETDGYSCPVIPKDNVLGWMDITEREWLVRWESSESDAEYAKVLRRENFIVKARNAKDASHEAQQYALHHRYCYYEDSIFCSMTDDIEDIEEAKNTEKVIYI